jgi:antitoxin component YwqK of YwqJK toxin-antitoxin module
MILKSKIDSKFAIVLLITLTAGAIFLITSSYDLTKQEMDLSSQDQPTISAQLLRGIAKEKVSYKIIEGNGKIISSALIASENSTVFSLLQDLSKKEIFKIESKQYEGMGVLVESIDGIKNGTDNKYWQYWINGELPMVAADKKGVKNGDKIEWRFDLADF